jgi:hypothetical protein
MPWGIFLVGLLLLSGALIRSTSVPRSRLLLLTGGWGAAFGLCTNALSRYPVEPIHATEYVVLALLTRWAFRTTFSGRGAWIWAFFFAAGVGAIEEGLQHWIPGRVYDPRDLILNSCAVFFGLVLAACIEYGRAAKKQMETRERNSSAAGR